MNSKDFFSALFIGAGLGLVAGILLAPASGSETIKKLSNGAKDRYNRLKGSAEDLADNLESEGKNLLDKGSSFAKKYMKDGEEKLDGLKSQLDKTTI
jgi:gas vesicle protein